MKREYAKLYGDCVGLEGFKEASHFVAMKGKYFETSECRVLVVGRSVNGWDTIDCTSPEEFGGIAEQMFLDTSRWDWIEEVDGTLYSACSDADQKKKKDRYCINKSAFWNYAKAIYQELTGEKTDTDVWMENIAWSNLYKISPKIQGNPEQDYLECERDSCESILKKELELLNPTHVIVMTAWDWFSDFASVFSDVVESPVKNISRGKNKNDVFVEGTAKFNDAKVVVMCRPEYRDKEKYVRDVVDQFTLE